MNDSPQNQREPRPESIALRALRFDIRSMFPIGMLFLVVLLTWCLAEFSTTVFRSTIAKELQAVTASDISVSSRAFPSDADRAELRNIAGQYQSKVTESVSFPYTVEIKNPVLSMTGSRFLSTELRIIDDAYPLYGSIVSSGSLTNGSLADGGLYELFSQS